MEILRTPAQRFDQITGFDWPVDRVHVPDGDGGTLEMAVTLAGADANPTVVCLHGEPTWSYLYRHVIEFLVDAGLRVVAPDLIGFGRSDKPAARSDHTYRRQAGWLRVALLDELGLDAIHLLCQDWGACSGFASSATIPSGSHRSSPPTPSSRPGRRLRARRSPPGSATPRRSMCYPWAVSCRAGALSTSIRG